MCYAEKQVDQRKTLRKRGLMDAGAEQEWARKGFNQDTVQIIRVVAVKPWDCAWVGGYRDIKLIRAVQFTRRKTNHVFYY